MPQEPWESVVDELGRRRVRRAQRPRGGPRPPRLSAPDLASVRVLSQRGAGDHRAVALTVNDATGDRYLIIRELVRDLDRDGGWRSCSGSEGLDRVIPGKPDPYVSFYAHAGGRFFAGGRVQSASTGVARVRLVWQDGYALEDEVHNGVVLFFGARDSLDRATAEFLDPAGRVLGAHVTLIDEGPRLPGSPPQIGAAATELGGHSTRKPRFSAWAG